MLKKQLIMDTALELFAKQGIASTSVQQITESCGISKGAFYLSFKSKEELVLELIDNAMKQLVSDLDYQVKHTQVNEDSLYMFYESVFSSFKKHSDQGKIFMNDHHLSVSPELINKIQYYDKLINSTILLLIEKVYGNSIDHLKYDLLYCIKGFLKTYSELFVFTKIPLDVSLLSKSLAEKTNLLAMHETIPFITEELSYLIDSPAESPVDIDTITTLLSSHAEAADGDYIKESLNLLNEQASNQTMSAAIINGLIENIRHIPYGKWLAYLLRQYFQLES